MLEVCTTLLIVALYERVSSDEQKNNCTIESQTKDLNTYLEANKHLHVYKCYKDDGISGTIPFSERPAGKQLMEDARNGKFGMVLVTRTDRLGRGMLIILRAVEILTSLDIKFRATLEPYNTEDPAGKYMFNSMANFAEYEINSIRQRTVKGINRIAESGKWPGGVPPYGYCLDTDKHLKIQDEKIILNKYSEADIVERMFYMLANLKMTCPKVANIFNEEGIPVASKKNERLNRKKAKIWIAAGIRQIIKREIYMGTFMFGKNSKDKDRKIPIEVTPIVDKATWDRAQETLSENGIVSLRNTKREYLLTGKIKCSICGRNFTGLGYRGYTYYACSNFRLKNRNDPTKCINGLIRADVLDNEIWKDISEIVKNPRLIREFIDNKLSGEDGFDIKSEIEKRKKRLEKLSIEKSKLVKYIRVGEDFLEKDLLIEIEKIKNEECMLNSELNHYADLAKNNELKNQKFLEIEKYLLKYIHIIDNPPFSLRKEIVRMLLKEVIVHPKDTETKSRDVEINYYFNKDIITTKLSLTE